MLVAVVLVALLALAGVAWLVVGRPNARGGRHAVLVRGVAAVALVLVAQGMAVVAVGLKVNDSYGFYASWNDLLGDTSTAGVTIHTGRLVAPGHGRVVVRSIHNRDAASPHQVMVWLPPQYDAPSQLHHRLPVVMFLPGQPSTPQVAFTHFRFGAVASQEIAAGTVPPFIGVFPPLAVSPPSDPECTNVPGGPRSETWLSKAVPRYVEQHFRASTSARNWSVMGFSEGGNCAAKLVLGRQKTFSSAASFAGYYLPQDDSDFASLLTHRHLVHRNSPTWLYQTRGLRAGRLLVIASRQDIETWRGSRRFLRVARGDPRVSSLTPAQGGHNYFVYAALLPAALRWTASGWGSRASGVSNTRT
jgi:hypothetical protein